ncbi:hypothetical protein F2Q70_00004134 [Brassica cretica]|uniref:Uncharacterized protein n=1 Tax=Brassica cretica TaxID=69181 RepID=A0A8S9IYT6_BRACR|nr:hypothetical protein F2Q70_00004134 [Brassica cretica]
MSFGGSQWCRPMSMDTHRSTDHDEDRSTDHSRHRSTSSAESTAEPPPKPSANPPEPTSNPPDTTPEPMQVDEATEGRRKQVCSAEGEEAVDMEGEEDVNYIGGTGFQRSGNQGENRNFYGNGQRSNQSSQFQKPFSNNSRGYGNSFY